MSKSADAATPRLMDYAAAAKYLGIEESYLRRLVKEGRILRTKSSDGRSGRVYFTVEQLEAWIASRAVDMDA
jgi:excisionase family DNA binding protein